MGESSSKRVLIQEKCSKDSIQVSQSPTVSLPNGTPQYTVQITNTCLGCTISKIHLNCGMFSSATVINPKIFRRLANNDCLVNDGQPLKGGAIISFKYATTFSFPLSVASVLCAWSSISLQRIPNVWTESR